MLTPEVDTLRSTIFFSFSEVYITRNKVLKQETGEKRNDLSLDL